MNKFPPDDALIVPDTGTVTTWAARYLQIRGDMLFSASGMLATMGNGLPYAVGAAVGNPGRPVAGGHRRRSGAFVAGGAAIAAGLLGRRCGRGPGPRCRTTRRSPGCS